MRGLKPVLSFQTAYGTSKLVPLRTSTSHRTFSAGCKVVPFQNPTSTTGCSRGRVSTSAAWWRAHEVRAYRSPIGRNDDWYALLRAIPEYSAVFAVSPLQVKSRPSGCRWASHFRSKALPACTAEYLLSNAFGDLSQLRSHLPIRVGAAFGAPDASGWWFMGVLFGDVFRRRKRNAHEIGGVALRRRWQVRTSR